MFKDKGRKKKFRPKQADFGRFWDMFQPKPVQNCRSTSVSIETSDLGSLLLKSSQLGEFLGELLSWMSYKCSDSRTVGLILTIANENLHGFNGYVMYMLTGYLRELVV